MLRYWIVCDRGYRADHVIICESVGRRSGRGGARNKRKRGGDEDEWKLYVSSSSGTGIKERDNVSVCS
jgi:hypothetical protein